MSFAAQSSRVTPTSRAFSPWFASAFLASPPPRIARPTISDSKYAFRSRTASEPPGDPSSSSAAAAAACFAAAASASATSARRPNASARRVASSACDLAFRASSDETVSRRVAEASASSSFSTRA